MPWRSDVPPRPRRYDRHLPPRLYHRHGAYWHVVGGRWTRLAADLATALRLPDADGAGKRLIARGAGGGYWTLATTAILQWLCTTVPGDPSPSLRLQTAPS